MTPGITFHRGNKKLKLGKAEINEAIEFPEDFEFCSMEQERRFFKNFVDDVTRFDEKMAHTTASIYDTATNEIATWILKKPGKSSKTKGISVFSPNEPIGTLKCALVQCNFTDISRLIGDFRQKLLEKSTENLEVRDHLVTENDAIHEIIDRILEKNTSSTTCHVIIIRQFESLRPNFFASLVSLLFSNSTCRRLIPRIKLMTCVSTSPAFFTQNCGLETANLMDLTHFRFTKLDDIFSKIIATGCHAHFLPPRPPPKNIEEDDPALLNNFDCAPAVFSGPFMKYLKNRFFACDYSISALSRAIQLALLQKYLEDPLWREDAHDAELQKYDRVLRVFLEEFGENPAEIDEKLAENLRCHVEIQSDGGDFWTKIRHESIFQERKSAIFDGNSTNLHSFLRRFLAKITPIDPKFCEKLENLRENLISAEQNPEKSEISPEKSITTTQKMSFLEMQKQRRSAMTAKQQNPLRSAKSAIFSHVMNLFETTLQPYPSTWRNVIGANFWIDDVTKTSLDASDEYDIENAMLNAKKFEKMPISVAWRCLLTHRNFKSVPMAEWAELFLRNVQQMSRKSAKGAFFAAAGQLEHIGLIRGAVDKKSTNVHVLYHPISFIPDI
ncbi:ORC_WH_C domain-containing protein [Caenorhabditis elegans]|uniref:ORC_WH_C domain-containing protein n=1 Tax=Caenorhabditis elegans TaxID=6239 RepID=Q95Y69_CAEEL|nr:ORC_WH_C domain-containing protein [Caenorhabditis elegans]CCD73920.1 ORC_WH_C domain-containing protein [Caenorhabditis elegans]|eukprot:NP_497349.2 ORC (Origin Recognition Complex) subunit [Caenorhabditis elegans]